MRRILIAGGTGFIGSSLISSLAKKGLHLSVLTRKDGMPSQENVKYYRWNVEKKEIDLSAFEGVSTIINLTGANIGEKRWTKQRKKEIIDSRVEAIRLLYHSVVDNGFSIDTFISSSAVGYYGAVTSETIYEETTDNGSDFLGQVCKAWERAAEMFEQINTRVVLLRKGVVLGQSGIYNKMSPLAKWGINPALGSGQQYLPWIDLEDLLRMYAFLLEQKDLKGCFNAVASEHLKMNDFALKLLQSFDKKSVLPNVPSFILKLMFGEMASMLLEGSRVSNSKIKNLGFEFRYDSVSESFERLCKG